MPRDLDQLAQDNNHQDQWRVPRWNNDLQDLAGASSRAQQQAMTHQPEHSNPAAPYLQGARNFYSQGLTGAIPGLRQAMPSWLNRIGGVFQSQAARDALSTANTGGLPLIEAIWTPRDLGILRKIYSANIDPYTLSGLIQRYLPGRSPVSVRQKAFKLGLTRPEIPPYVRQPGSPSIANDPPRAAQIAELLKKGMSSTEISSHMGDVSARSVRRYISENLNRPKLAGIGASAVPPGMPKFSFQDEVVSGDPEYERELLKYLQQKYAQ